MGELKSLMKRIECGLFDDAQFANCNWGIRSIKHLFTENQKYLFDSETQNQDDLLKIDFLGAKMAIENGLLAWTLSDYSSNIEDLF